MADMDLVTHVRDRGAEVALRDDGHGGGEGSEHDQEHHGEDADDASATALDEQSTETEALRGGMAFASGHGVSFRSWVWCGAGGPAEQDQRGGTTQEITLSGGAWSSRRRRR